MNQRIDYKFKALCLRLLLMIARKLDCHNDPKVSGRNYEVFEQDVRKNIAECEAISDGRIYNESTAPLNH